MAYERSSLVGRDTYLERPLRGSDFCSDIGEMSEEVLDVPWYMKSETARTATVTYQTGERLLDPLELGEPPPTAPRAKNAPAEEAGCETKRTRYSLCLSLPASSWFEDSVRELVSWSASDSLSSLSSPPWVWCCCLRC